MALADDFNKAMNDILFAYDVSFRCYFPGDGVCNHMQRMPLKDIPRWIDSYRFTHPNCVSISVKVWFSDLDK